MVDVESKYPHTQVVSDPPTPLYLKLYTVMIMLRYGPRAVDKITEAAGPAVMRHYGRELDEGQRKKFIGVLDKIAEFVVGVFSLGITTYHRRRTKKDIMNIFCETAALELDKNPQQVTWEDLEKSKNVMIEGTISRFKKVNAWRYITDGIFFVGTLPKMPAVGTDAGMFAKGVLLANDITRQPSIFETLQRLVGAKFGVSGLGNDVTAHELKELYNVYARKFDPSRQILAADVERWNNNEVMFKRVAYLINHSYRERRIEDVNPTTPKPGRLIIQKQENFRLPELLYMMGHGYLNLDKPEQTMAYVEIANSHGIKAVQQARADIEKGTSLEDIIKQHNVVLPSYVITKATTEPEAALPKATDLAAAPPLEEAVLQVAGKGESPMATRMRPQPGPESLAERVKAASATADTSRTL